MNNNTASVRRHCRHRRRGLQRQHSSLSLLLFHPPTFFYHLVALIIIIVATASSLPILPMAAAHAAAMFANNGAFVPPSSVGSGGRISSNVIAATTRRSLQPRRQQRQQRRFQLSVSQGCVLKAAAASANERDFESDDNNDTATPLSWSTATTPHAPTLRAGESGYSVSRRPITTLDPDILPTFVVTAPRDIEEESGGRRRSLLQPSWSSGNGGKNNNRPWLLDETKTSREGLHDNDIVDDDDDDNAHENDENDEGLSSLNLHARTLKSLDYPIVLRALANECNTNFGIELVLSRMTMSLTEEGKPTTKSSSSSSSSSSITNQQLQRQQRLFGSGSRQKNNINVNVNDDDDDVLTMPLTSMSVDGCQSRYTAVREMERLLDGDYLDRYIIGNRLKSSINGSSYRSTVKAPRIPLGIPPISTGGGGGNLRPILDLIYDGRILEGSEIQDVASELRLCLDVLDWRDALLIVNKEEEGIENDNHKHDDDCMTMTKSPSFVELPKLTNAINVNIELLQLLTDAFDPTDPNLLDGTTFPSLGRLRTLIQSTKREVLANVNLLLASSSMKGKLATESGGSLIMEINGRLVIPIKRNEYSSSTLLQGGIVHDASRSGNTIYVEPPNVIERTNDLRRIESELRSEESRIWRLLTEAIDKHIVDIERNIACLGQLDVVLARVKLGKLFRAASGVKGDGGRRVVIPTVGTEGVIHVQDALHPILLLRDDNKQRKKMAGKVGIMGSKAKAVAGKGGNVVGSDVDIGRGTNQGLILTGPNSGGKTIILKLLGLYAFMVRDGIPLPSGSRSTNPTDARVDYFSPILADIGDSQSVDGDLSTFSGHMLVCREVLTNANKDALVLMDELGSGTDPNQGVAIARALLESLLDRGCRVAITTHYLELKQLAITDDRFAVAGMQFVGGRPTYRLIPGVIGESFALAVAERLKLPQSVINRAYELLDTETRKMGELIQELEDQKLLVDMKFEELLRQENEMLELKAEMKLRQEKLELTQLTARREEARKFAAKLEEKERLLEDILEKLKGSGASKKVVADSWSDIRIVKREALSEAENMPGIMSRLKQQLQQDQNEAVELVPISEMTGTPPIISVNDIIIVCKRGAFHGREGIVKQVGKKIQVDVSGTPVRLTTAEIAFPPSSGMIRTTNNVSNNSNGREGLSKMAQRALELDSSANTPVEMSLVSTSSSDSGTTMKTNSNTVDCIGLNFEESKRKCIDAFSKATMQNMAMVRVYLRRRYVRGSKRIGNGQRLFGLRIRQMEEMH